MNFPLPHHPTIITFKSPDAFFEYVRGPAQHDAHLDTRRKAIWLQEQRAFCDGAQKRVREWANGIGE